MKKEENTTYRILIKTAATCLLALLMVGGVSAQYKGNPVKKDKLVSVLRSKQLQTREIVAVVKSNGVDFQLTPALEKELVTAGARPEVITAIRDNYRQPSAASNPSVASKNNNNKKFTGQPLAKDAIVTLLENGVPDAQVRKNVQARGVNFKVNSQNISEIKRAGGSVALVNLIGASFVSDVGKPSDAGNNTTGSTAGSNAYDDLIDKAVDFYDNKKDKQAALASLQQAVKMDVNNSRAYQLLGYMNLYGFSNFAEAERICANH